MLNKIYSAKFVHYLFGRLFIHLFQALAKMFNEPISYFLVSLMINSGIHTMILVNFKIYLSFKYKFSNIEYP